MNINHAISKTGADTGTQVFSGYGELMGVRFDAGSSSDYIILYDGINSSGNIIFKATGSTSMELPSIVFKTGLFRVQTGTNSVSIIYANRNV